MGKFRQQATVENIRKHRLSSLRGLIAHTRLPLYRNAYALILSSMISSGVGVLYWVLAAHRYSTEDVGRNSAAISAMIFLSGIAQLNMGDALIRFVPRLGRATGRLVGYTYGISSFLSAMVCIVFFFALSAWFPALGFIRASPFSTLWFIVATITWSIFTLQDDLLAGLRRAVWIPLENFVFAIAKVALLLVFARAVYHSGILASWTLPVIVSVAPINIWIFRHLMPKHVQATISQAGEIHPIQIAKYIFGNYLAYVFALTSSALLPIIVTQELGATANAYFYQPWSIVFLLQLVTRNIATSFTVEAATDPTKIDFYGHRTLVQMVRLLIPAVIVLLVGAPVILRIFGDSYTREGTSLLRLLALATIPNIASVLYISVARVRGAIREIVFIEGSQAALVLGLSHVLLHRYGIAGVGIAWLISRTCMASVLVLARLRSILRPTDFSGR